MISHSNVKNDALDHGPFAMEGQGRVSRHGCRPRISRRALLAAGGALAAGRLGIAAEGKPGKAAPTILLKSGWQTVNIGDIAHTPGMLAVLEKHIPEARVVLWPIAVNDAVEKMLLSRFPRLTIAPPELRTNKTPPDDAVRPLMEGCDFYLHGSGPNPMCQGQLRQWIRLTGKPFGFGGVTFPSLNDPLAELLSQARFIGCRETRSQRFLREKGIAEQLVSFAPDAAFACDVRDETKARAFMQAHDLEPGRYGCFVPRLRWTPFHKMDQWHTLSPEKIEETERVNAETGEKDHAKLREAIVRWVRETGMKAVICPEMTYALDVIDPLVFDPLPADVKPKVVRRTSFWITDEACSLYRHARAMASIEMHSPILSLAQGVPAVHIRQPEDTWKGQMWRDIGLEAWLLEIDEASGAQIADTMLRIDADYPAAQAKVRESMKLITDLQATLMATLRQSLPRG